MKQVGRPDRSPKLEHMAAPEMQVRRGVPSFYYLNENWEKIESISLAQFFILLATE